MGIVGLSTTVTLTLILMLCTNVGTSKMYWAGSMIINSKRGPRAIYFQFRMGILFGPLLLKKLVSAYPILPLYKDPEIDMFDVYSLRTKAVGIHTNKGH